MEELPVTTKSATVAIILSIVILILNTSRTGNETRIVFCDVGQGNAAYIRTRNGLDIVVDTGPDKSVISCLGKYMPFYDRKIELMIITHPDSDHYGGATFLIKRYKVGQIIINDLNKTDSRFVKFIADIKSLKIPVKGHFSGDKIDLRDGQIVFYWPPVDFMLKNDNDASLVLGYLQGNFSLLFTGDCMAEVFNWLDYRDIGHVDIVVVPHHGSRNGLTEKFLRLAEPKVAVISVGKNNRFGHPAKTTLDLLEGKKIKIMRTDKNGDIIFKIHPNDSSKKNAFYFAEYVPTFVSDPTVPHQLFRQSRIQPQKHDVFRHDFPELVAFLIAGR